MLQVIPRRTNHQRNLQRYMAYRAAAWKVMNAPAQWKELVARTGIDKATLASIVKGKTSSQKLAMKLSASIGPAPLESFLALADAWAEAFPEWEAEDAVSEPIGYLSLSSEDRWADMTQRHPVALMRAGRALLLLEEAVSETTIQDAIDLAWLHNRDDVSAYTTPRDWLPEVERALKRIQRGSGERDSVQKILLTTKR